jgi:hypothetical protein
MANFRAGVPCRARYCCRYVPSPLKYFARTLITVCDTRYIDNYCRANIFLDFRLLIPSNLSRPDTLALPI